MSDNFFRSLIKLASVEPDDIPLLSRRISEMLAAGKGRNISGVVYSLLQSVDITHPEFQLKEAIDTGFANLAIREYEDGDGLRKVAIGLAILQDYRHSEKNFDKFLAQAIREAVYKKGFQFVFNDISVNSIQLRTEYEELEDGAK